MGFLNNLLNKEAKKIISGVMDSVVDTVVDNARDALKQGSPQAASTGRGEPVRAARKTVIDEEDDCCCDMSIVQSRIEKIVAENWSGCEMKKAVRSSEIGADEISWEYSYGIYRDGKAVAMINLLDNPNDYKRKIVLQSGAACQKRGIGYVHFLMHLPNRSSYILKRLQEIIPA